MADEILTTRLTEVKRTLERASLARLSPVVGGQQPLGPESRWCAVALNLPELEKRVIKPIWTSLETQFKDESKVLTREIEKLERRLASLAKGAGEAGEKDRDDTLERVWEEYRDVERRAEELLGEIVELLGGLAFRDRSVDPWFFGVADQLVFSYATLTGDPWDPLTVPSVRHAVTRTLARIVGLRFPDWSPWALPLLGYEFAYQYLGFTEKGIRIARKVKESLAQDFELDGLGDFRVLLSDAFATFTTGPAYMFAALGLRLSSREAARGVVIIRTLELLDEGRQYPKEFLEEYKNQWELSPISGPRLDLERKENLQRFAEEAFKILRDSFLDPVRYSGKEWVRAKQVFEGWKSDAGMPGGYPLDVPQIDSLRLVDALNAAWFCRFCNIADTDRLEEAARNLCDRIIETEPGAARRTDQQPALQAQPGVRR